MDPGKPFLPQPECNCRLKCHEHIPLAQQESIFNKFYSISTNHKKRLYITGQIHVKPVENKKDDAQRPRTVTRHYYLEDEYGVQKNICKLFFLNCLHINSALVHRILEKTSKIYTSRDSDEKTVSEADLFEISEIEENNDSELFLMPGTAIKKEEEII